MFQLMIITSNNATMININKFIIKLLYPIDSPNVFNLSFNYNISSSSSSFKKINRTSNTKGREEEMILTLKLMLFSGNWLKNQLDFLKFIYIFMSLCYVESLRETFQVMTVLKN